MTSPTASKIRRTTALWPSSVSRLPQKALMDSFTLALMLGITRISGSPSPSSSSKEANVLPAAMEITSGRLRCSVADRAGSTAGSTCGLTASTRVSTPDATDSPTGRW